MYSKKPLRGEGLSSARRDSVLKGQKIVKTPFVSLFIAAAALLGVVAFTPSAANAEKFAIPMAPVGCHYEYEEDGNNVLFEIYLVCPAEDGGEDWTPVLHDGKVIHFAPSSSVTTDDTLWSVCVPCVLDYLDSLY